MAVSTDFVIPELLSDQIKVALAKRRVLLGSAAVVTNPSLPTASRGGSRIKVPYLGTLGEAETLAEDVALTPATVTPDNEEAIVIRVGKAITMSRWAELQAAYADPYVALGGMLAELINRAQEQSLVDAATATISGMTYTVPGTGTLDYDAVLKAKQKWGDEQDDIVMMAMHSKAFFDILGLKDSTGRPLGVETIQADGSTFRSFAGCPVFVSDFMPLASSVYTTALFKRSSMLLWTQGEARVEEVNEPLKDRRVAAINAYYTAYRYKFLDGRSKGGVALIKHA